MKSYTKKNVISFVLILLLALLSISVRLPNISKTVHYRSDYATSHLLRTMQIWYESGALKNRFLPVLNFDNRADKNINNQSTTGHRDPEGNYYYTTSPPFSLIFPHLILKPLHIYPSFLSLVIMNLFFHCISAFFVYLIISLLTEKHYTDSLNTPAVVGFAVYLFSPVALWFHANAFAPQLFVQWIFVIGIYLCLKIVVDEKPKGVHYLLLGLANFFMIYTEWLGAFFAFSVFVYAFFRIKRKEMRTLLYVISFSTAASLLFLIWHYSLINGFQGFIETNTTRYGAEAVHSPHLNIKLWLLLGWYYVKGYLPVLLVFFTMLCLYAASCRMRTAKDVLRDNRNELFALYISAVPAVLYYMAFFVHTSRHEFIVLKTAVFIAVVFSLLYDSLMRCLRPDNAIKRKLIKALIVLMIIGCVAEYLAIDRKSADPRFKNIGETIARTAKKDEVVFIKGDIERNESYMTWPQFVLYARRNLAVWKNEQEARELLKLNNAERGVIFIVDRDVEKVIGVEYISR